MHFFFLFLLLCITQAFAPSYIPDLTTRNIDDTAKREQDEELFRNNQRAWSYSAHVVSTDPVPRSDSTGDHSIAVTTNDSEDAQNVVPPTELEQRIAKGEVVKYITRVKDDADVEKFRDFLKSKAEDGNDIYQIGPDDDIRGYGNVTLTADSKRDVENYEGTFSLMEDWPIHFLSAVPEKRIAKREVVNYIALAKKGIDIEKYHEYLKTKAEDSSGMYQIGPDEKILGYGHVVLTQEAKTEVENHQDTFGMLEDVPIVSLRALPTEHSPRATYENLESIDRREKLLPRALTWKSQDYADDALVMDSQYPDSRFVDFTEFVYPENPGQGIFVYVLDLGVQIKVKNPDDEREFKTDNDRVLQSTKSINENQSPDTDDNPNLSHRTQVSSKALGKKFGLAEEATLVSTKLYPESGDWENAMWLILRDIRNNPGRASRSVVTTSMAIGGGGITPEAARNNARMQELYGNDLRALSNLGVPFVMASGNGAKQPNRGDVDQLPMVLQDDDIPLIIVGGSDWDGKRGDFSQAGPLVTVYAPGVDIECQTKVDKTKAIASRSSLAAPQVAGLIATYLSYSTKPWDDSKTGVERVKAIRDYIVSEHSSWERAPDSGIRVIWNGATKDDHKHVSANEPDDSEPPRSSPVPEPPPTPSRKDKALSIIFQGVMDGISNDNSWLFFKGDYGESSVCRPFKDALKMEPAGSDSAMVDNPPWPGGTYVLNDLVDGVKCAYRNDGSNPGALWCQNWDALPPTESQGPLSLDVVINCKEEVRRWDHGAEVCEEGGIISVAHHPVVSCDW